MALVKSFFKISKDRQLLRSEVDCSYTISVVDGRRILQLETYGSSDRQHQGKTSQNIQLDERAGRELMTILRDAFPSLR